MPKIFENKIFGGFVIVAFITGTIYIAWCVWRFIVFAGSFVINSFYTQPIVLDDTAIILEQELVVLAFVIAFSFIKNMYNKNSAALTCNPYL